ncbi:kynureninase [Ramlibacter albus]|uniref:Kynureninase n=1 Tax=Ramlibacter albus TaxID=2079448 RepID=A0A923S4B8_9BURK|nr:kynureninase [Ramlibacter albus]MBC5767434.1 kynureninase [Ramlibacter albus]
MSLTLEHCRERDARDPLRPLRDLFTLPAGVIYLDGNSLGPMPKAAAPRVAQAVQQEWGEGLIRSWNSAGWFELPQRLGDKIGTIVGAKPGEVVATDSTSINLFKVLSAALSIASAGSPQRKVVVSERSNFPTDLYIAEALCKERGLTLKLVEPHEIAASLDSSVAVLMLTHVNYRTGAMHDMRAVTRRAHESGALTVWDLAHSAGAVEVDLHGAHADFAIGCGYKYLNGGPGAPAFVWVHPRHADRFWQPLAGWWSHEAPFEFTPHYRPAAGIARYLCGTQPILSMTALECGLDTVLAAQPFGGMKALREKSLALTDTFIALVEERCAGHGVSLVTPREHALRGSQVCLAYVDPHASLPPEGASAALGRPGAGREGAYAIVQALIARGVIGDFRAPEILRFGFTPLYLGFEDVWNAVEHLREVLATAEWKRDEFNRRNAVT